MVTLLDGGTGQELVALASGKPTALWSAQAMLDEPDLVERVHRSYLDVGADVITLNTYSATRCRLAPEGLEDQYATLQQRAGEAAVTARAASGRTEALIAGCLSPYRWSYRPELAPPYDELWPTYAESARLQAPYVDVMLCETLGSIDEARAAARGASEAGVPIWISWTLHDDDTTRLRSGEALADACDSVATWGVAVDAILVNCSIPEALTPAIPVLARHARRPFGAYANGFTHVGSDYSPGSIPATDLGNRLDLGPADYADIVDRWIDGGAKLVGGCCDIGPAHIAEIRHRLDR